MTSIDALAIRRLLGRNEWLMPHRHGPDGWSFVRHDQAASIIVTCADHDDGNDWIHASIARPNRMPDYQDLKLLHHTVFGDGWAYQVFAPQAEHVNIHQYCLHLWGRLDGKPALPDFTQGIGSI